MRTISVLIITFFAYIMLLPPAYSQSDQTEQKPTVIIVAGAAGTAEYGAVFTQCVKNWQQAASQGNAKSIVIGMDEGSDDRTILRQTLKNEPNETDLVLWLVLIGHGTFDGRTAKFNLRGPDLSSEDLAEWLKSLNRPIVIIDTSSSSAPFLSKLSGNNRIVITATKSGYELNYTRFGQYLAESIIDTQADLDKDGQISLLEAFLTASNRVAEFYSSEGRLATEHALLDDNGDKLGTRADWFRGVRPVKTAEGGAALDGYRANQFCLVHSEEENKMPPELRAKRDRLELEVIKLRDSKDSFTEEEYFSRLEKMLYDIALIYEQADHTENSPE